MPPSELTTCLGAGWGQSRLQDIPSLESVCLGAEEGGVEKQPG